MKKLTQQQIEEIIFMKNKQVPTIEITKQFNIGKGTIYWHTSQEYRQRIREYQRRWYHNLTPEKKKEYLNRRRDYQRVYHKGRYTNDPIFRKKQIDSVKRNKRSKKT